MCNEVPESIICLSCSHCLCLICSTKIIFSQEEPNLAEIKCPACDQVTLLSEEIQEAFEELFQNGEINLEECLAGDDNQIPENDQQYENIEKDNEFEGENVQEDLVQDEQDLNNEVMDENSQRDAFINGNKGFHDGQDDQESQGHNEEEEDNVGNQEEENGEEEEYEQEEDVDQDTNDQERSRQTNSEINLNF